MNFNPSRSHLTLIPAAAGLLAASPSASLGCACGCGVFDVATSSMLPQGPGSMLFLQYSFQDQNQNWSGSSPAPSSNNPDKDIRTDFLTVGLQTMVNRDWGFQVEVPYDSRGFQTTGGATDDGLVSVNWHVLGDVRVTGIYTGFSEDMSSGLIFGVKLPTGNFTYNDAYQDIDRDSEIGTGTTDVLVGGFSRGHLSGEPDWSWFAQALGNLPLNSRDQYRPGDEVDAALGLSYSAWRVGAASIFPLAQAIFSYRSSDSGAAAADPVASGYRRILLAPGLEADVGKVKLYADVEIPAYQHFTGNQLAARTLFKTSIAYSF